MQFNAKRFAKWMKKVRKDKGYTMNDVARITGMHSTSIAKIETGELDVRMTSFIKICACYGAPPHKIMNEMVDVL